MRAQFHTRTTPTALDPWGMDPNGPDDPQTIEVRAFREGETIRIERGGERWAGLAEGSEPGQVSARSGLSMGDEGKGRARLGAAIRNGGPQTKLAARAVRSGLTGNGIRQVAADLRSVIDEPPSDTVGALAVLALGFLLREARDDPGDLG